MAYDYKYDNSGGQRNGGGEELISWLIVVAALVFFWPVGLFLLFRKLNGGSFSLPSNRGRKSQHPYDIQQDQAYQSQAPKQEDAPRAQSAPTGAKQSASGRSGYSYQYEYRYQSQGRNQAGWQSSSAGRGRDRDRTAPGMQGVPTQGRSHKGVDLNKGKAMTVWGGILTAVFGLSAISAIPSLLLERDFAGLFAGGGTILGFLCLGIILIATGTQRNKKAKRFRKYLALIGKRSSIAISSLAQAMPVGYQTACDDLQDMLDEGYIPTGYLDMASGRLILSDEGLQDAAPEPEVEEEPEEEVVDNDTFLMEIKQINDAIADEEMSRKIDRIGEITAKILDYQRKNPSRASQLHSFLSYYLPTTLKILRAYAQMEAQGIEGENIRSAKQRIEGMMDKVVEGFEKQLDKLFQDDAMDITTDVEVLERMLDKDGLAGGSGDMFQMGG